MENGERRKLQWNQNLPENWKNKNFTENSSRKAFHSDTAETKTKKKNNKNANN